ncbi:EAL domain-containing protein [Rugamonas sp. CCM 8940]|uniref:bifunctional diguanylate cyclase/phosphodiesterase n=1 Tax=Rugamonas sp. CCM 8940 TaxID=2765359 RepID=UPI0018F4F4D6|nr:EAL domain-containing protein [Rugamonas sp. CCM 8940]MBJ7310594.1 EAL domain-containing protein [Rugamonas sp. CCM 8940]
MERLIRRVRFSVSLSALLTLMIGLALTFALFFTVRQFETARQNAQFQQNAKLRINAVVGSLHDAVAHIEVLSQLFSTFGVISREQFHRFTAPLRERSPQIQALSFQRLIQSGDRAAYETAMRRRFPGFTLTELVDGRVRRAGLRDAYLVIDYLEPLFGNEGLLGLDTAPMPEWTEARRLSRERGSMAASGALPLLLTGGRQTGFRVLSPIFWQGAPIDTAAARQRAAIGEIAAELRADSLLEPVLQAQGFPPQQGMSMLLYATTAGAAPRLIARYGNAPPPHAGLAQGPTMLPAWLFYDRPAPVKLSFTLANQTLLVEASQAEIFFAHGHNASLYALLGGLLSTVLAAAYVYALVSRIATIERVTRERTAALEFANLRLAEDIARHAQTEQRLQLRERVIEVSANAIILCSAQAPEYPIEYVNPAFERITGFSAQEVLGRSLDFLHGSQQYQGNIEQIHTALREQSEGHALVRHHHKDGSGYWSDLFVAPVQDQSGAVSHFVVAQYDISAAMGYEAEIEYQATHDSLTGLANRNLLRDRLNEAISGGRRRNGSFWVAFLDLDRFKFVNDTLGHEAGDSLLKIVAGRLLTCVRETDTVARLGGDEFMLVLPENPEDGTGVVVLTRIMEAVALPIMVQGHEFFLTCSVGVATYPTDGDSAESLTRYADIAMYRAKELGRNAFQFYTAQMNERTLDRLKIEADLRRALERDEFVLHYQPQLSFKSGQIIGMEALLRWNHPTQGMIAPTRFIGLAEDMGLIIPIGAWVLRTACLQTMAWHRAGWPTLRVAVNLSPRQFMQQTLVQSIAGLLRETGMVPQLLELELTEGTVMSDVDSAIEILRDLKALGVHISIDDFGTGYSSLSYLRRFPIDV